MKISRSELRERVRKILVGTLLDEGEKVSDKLLDTVIKYYFLKSEMLTDGEKKFLEESYVDLIGRKEREKIKEEIDIERVKKIVSAFSLSKKSSLLEEFPFEKDLRIFDNVEKIYLFYTKETETKFNEYKKNCKFKEKIEGIEIDGREVNETYKKLKELVLKNKVNKDNTVLDMTLGMKTISIAFYRIAVERQIKAINWNEKFLSSYTQINENEFEENENGPTPRISLSAKLSLMREPIKESLGIYSRINANIKKGNYEVVSDFYKIIGIDDMAFFYKKLDEIFDIESEDESDIFYRKLEKKLEEILKYSNFEEKNKNRIKKVVQYFSKLVIYFEKGNFEKLEWLIKNNEYEIRQPKTEVEENTLKEEIEGFDDRLYFECLKVKYKIIRTKEKLINIVDDLDIKLKDYKDDKTSGESNSLLLIMLSILQSTPYHFKYIIYDDEEWLFFHKSAKLSSIRHSAMNRAAGLELIPMISSTRDTERNKCMYIHTMLPHYPYGVNKFGKIMEEAEFGDFTYSAFNNKDLALYSAKLTLDYLIAWFEWMKEADV